MYTIATRLPIAIAHARVVTAAARGAHVTAITQVHALPAIPVAIAVLAIGLLMLVVRVNYALVELVIHLAQFAAAVGRALIVIALVAGIAAIILLHL